MHKFADRIGQMEESAEVVRKLFGSMTTPELISFGGGAPANEALPIEILQEIAQDVLGRDKKGIEAYQYGSPYGSKDLRDVIVKDLLKPFGIESSRDNILITAGGLECVNIVCQLFINPGDVILVESPTFVQCFEVFKMFGAECISCNMDDNGMIIEDLEEKIKKYNPKIIYTIPTFHNPTGRTLSKDRREKLANLASQYDVLVLEDDPYRDIRYSGEVLPPIKYFDKTNNVITANSFSKIFSPGCRLGYLVADEEVIKRAFDIKTATNSHTSMLPQVLCYEFFDRGYFPNHLKNICGIYEKRRDAMVDAIGRFFPEGTKYTHPDGGLFAWAELPGDIDTSSLLEEAVNVHNVAYIAGEGFFTDGGGRGKNSMRLSFGNVKEENIYKGIEILGNLIKSKL